jgi:hypothetical protein
MSNSSSKTYPLNTKKDGYIRWDDGMKLSLAKRACYHHAYISTTGKNALTMEQKWKKVIEDLANDPLFSGKPIGFKSWESVQTQFHRFRLEVTTAYGIDDEAVNLSGLDDEPSQYVTLM